MEGPHLFGGAALRDGKAVMAKEEEAVEFLIDEWVIENYDSIVGDEVRNVSYEDIAKHAEEMDDKNLAAWARKRAAESGKKVTPKAAAAKPKTTR